jgi:hypothetical protein
MSVGVFGVTVSKPSSSKIPSLSPSSGGFRLLYIEDGFRHSQPSLQFNKHLPGTHFISRLRRGQEASGLRSQSRSRQKTKRLEFRPAGWRRAIA